MAINKRTMAATVGAISAAGVAGAAIVAGWTGDHANNVGDSFTGLFRGAAPICLQTNIPFIEDLRAGCYSKDALAEFSDKPVLDDDGEPVVIRLSHPTDDLHRPTEVATCAVFTEIHRKGWYAPSSREMRREAYFVRACGTLELLNAAKKPEITYFENGGLSDADIESIANGPPFRMAASLETGSASSGVEKAGENKWRLRSDGQSARIELIAHADFNDDGYGDVLAFVLIGVDEGTAHASMVGTIEKISNNEPARFKPAY